MTLGQKQRLFVRLQNEWMAWCLAQGYEFTHGDALRDKRAYGEVGQPANFPKAYGHSKSAHKLKLAKDWNLFIDGEFQRTTKAHLPLGEKWESMHELCRWGGRFKKADGNHYSMYHNGMM